jgi:hypothetical protein
MPEYCSCGAQLPPDAVFCHKCGKPQRDIAAAEPAPPPPVYVPPAYGVPAPQPAVQAMPVGFRNPIAFRTALLVGLVGGVASALVGVLGPGGAGFFAVLFYRRATRGRVNVAQGIRMGWITGVIMFTMWGLVILVIGLNGVSASQLEQVSKEMALQPNDPRMTMLTNFFTVLATPSGLLACLVLTFVVIVCLSVAGGALAAKAVGGDS